MTKPQEIGQKAKAATRVLANADAKKDATLISIAGGLVANVKRIISANKIDLEQTRVGGMSESMLNRLTLNEARIGDMTGGTRQAATQTDPIGRILSDEVRPSGMKIEKVVVPLGVIGMIYETRPNVTAGTTVPCLKAGNAIILRGGKEAVHSNAVITEVMCDAVESIGLPRNSIQLIEDTSRQSSAELMGLTEYLDVLIPRGGTGLIRSVKENSHVSVIEAGMSNCHVYMNDGADLEMAARIIFNSRTPRPPVYNTAEALLVRNAVVEKFLPVAKKTLDKEKVQLRADKRALQNLGACDTVILAVENDWATEFSNYILAVRVMDSLDEAVERISRYSSGHSETIVANNYGHVRQLTSHVDAAVIYMSVSTCSTSNSQFGLGAEIGIFTQKLHTRGPMGVNELISQEFVITDDGQIREQ